MKDIERQFLKLELPEALYEADLALHDRAQSFSGELLRLGMAGIAVVGFLLANFAKECSPAGPGGAVVKLMIAASVIAFALSVAAALWQRFLASAAMFHHLQAIKLSVPGDQATEPEIIRNLAVRKRKFLRSHRLLKMSAFLLVLAATILSAAFVLLMMLSDVRQ